MSIEFEDLSGGKSRKRRPNGWMLTPLANARNAKGEWVLLDRYEADQEKLARGDATGVQAGYQTKQAGQTDDLFDARIGFDDVAQKYVVEIRKRDANVTSIPKKKAV